MTTEAIKQSVVNTYGQLAKSKKGGLFSKLFACCNNPATIQAISEKIGYSQEELSAVPEEANLGVGCGNPSAIAKIQPGATVVDLGSGAGFDAFLVARQVGPSGKVIGIDLSDDMLELARRNAKKGAYSQVTFKKGDIEDLPLADATADYIISNCVINLSLNKRAVYKEAYRVLKEGGRLSISDVVLEKELPAVVKESLAGHIACVGGAEKLDAYLQYVKEAGFKDITIESKNKFPLELMLADPTIKMVAKAMNFDLDSEEAKDIAGRVASISLSAKK